MDDRRIAVICIDCNDVADHQHGLSPEQLFDLASPTYRTAIEILARNPAVDIQLDGIEIDTQFYLIHKNCTLGLLRANDAIERLPDYFSDLVLVRKDELKESLD